MEARPLPRLLPVRQPPCPPSMSSHLQVTNVFEDEGIIDVDLLADFVVHGVHVRLVHGHTLLGQR